MPNIVIRASQHLLCITNRRTNTMVRRGGADLTKRPVTRSMTKMKSTRNSFTTADVTQWGKSFRTLLANQEGRKLFTKFLKSEFCDENIRFYEACEELERMSDEDDIFRQAKFIYSSFISAESDSEVSITSPIRDRILEGMINPNKETFNEAQIHIYDLMRTDSYSRFKNSEIYKRALAKTMPRLDGIATSKRNLFD